MRSRLPLIGGVLGLALGIPAGLGLFTFIYADGASYMTNDPTACANCHVMQNHLDAWAKSSHHHVAVCNDCHTPENFIGKYLTKASNGYHHSMAFTFGFKEPIRITPRNLEVTEAACRKCHADIVQAIDAVHRPGEAMSCVRCHSQVGHAE
ncbi:MAG TPA: cytochrome c nitrite reductase small subunit [Phycisphaerae bacterium]|nr:cytochrome c nitrite reductase small subunit [Phycisphaerae bacterium]HOM52682.1 cytochrome c nitrite reductase small subunit [Phycisphaerae bacterium]HPP25496.1 cytochrome c nitrite reductase small subunit [Phycisphaerae bacterium]